HRGRRLVHSNGVVLTILSAGLLIGFGGITDNLIPLFAFGAFLAFTMSQVGMVAPWRKVGEPHAFKAIVINAAGAICTAITLVVVLASKFVDGAWVMLLLIPALLQCFTAYRLTTERLGEKWQQMNRLTLLAWNPPWFFSQFAVGVRLRAR